MGHAADVTVRPAGRVSGRLRVPGDKSISHRALMLGALARGRTEITNLTPGQDGAATMDCLRRLGVPISLERRTGSDLPVCLVEGVGGLEGLRAAPDGLDAMNSGTTTRLLTGVLAGAAFETTIDGDASLRGRPMGRVVAPLEQMGAAISTANGRLPLRITGRPLHGIAYTMPVASAQVKSAILLAGLFADGTTSVHEPSPTRDHTERALAAFGGVVRSAPGFATVPGRQQLTAARVDVPGDPSSAAFWAAAAAAMPGSAIEIAGVGLNPGRIGFLDVLRRYGAQVDVDVAASTHPQEEPTGTLRVSHRDAGSVRIDPPEVPGLIDELPVLAALATHGGELVVTGAEELRVKESDRITSLAAGLRAMGAAIDEFPDGFRVTGARRLSGGTVDAAGDHRLAMAFAIAALGASGPSVIHGAGSVAVSYPGFFDVLASVCA